MATRTTPCLANPTPDVLGDAARAAREPAAIDPDHHGQIAGGRIGRTPDVQVQAVLRRSLNGGRSRRGGAARSGRRRWEQGRSALSRRRTGARTRTRRRPEPSLHAVRSEFRGLAHARPLRRRLRRSPPQLADGRRREGDALEGDDAVGDHALQLAAIHPHKRTALANARRCQHSSPPPGRPASTTEAWSPSKPPWCLSSRSARIAIPCRLCDVRDTRSSPSRTWTASTVWRCWIRHQPPA